jgi:hypothetical protein
MADAPAMNELLGADAPTNWGKWGPDDELGGVEHVRSGDVFTLDKGENFDHTDLEAAAAAQNVTIEPHDAAAPLEVVSGTAAPVNPLAIR